ncbi:MAG: pitrilysin family protein [Patescibacteria group bacterium]
MFKHSLKTLDCGLPVITVPMPGVKSVTTLLLCNTGSRYEKEGKEGIAHFFEHMPAKGTKNYPDAFTFASTLDSIGANFNAYTSKEYTGYYVHAASEHVDLALDVVSDMVLAPKLRQKDIDVEKGVIVEEINMYRDMPSRHIGNLFEQMIYSGSGLGHDIIGSKKTVTSFKSSDFKNFLDKWYGLENMLLIVAGDKEKVGNNNLLSDINNIFGKKNKDKKIKKEKIKLDKWLGKPISNKKLHIEYKKTEQAHFVMGWPGISRNDNKKYALSLLSTIMGGNMSSRLFSEVREKRGLCYYVHSDVDLYHDTGIFGASAGVDPNRVEEAVKVTVEEFYKAVSSQKVDKKELQKAKDYVTGKMVLGLEDSQSVASYFGMKQLLQNKIETPEEVLSKIKAVNLDEIRKVAEDLIKSGELRFAVIGPYDKPEVFKNIIK